MLIQNIKRKCEEKGLSLAEVEREAGLQPRSIYKWSDTTPAVDKVAKVAKILETPIEELLNA